MHHLSNKYKVGKNIKLIWSHLACVVAQTLNKIIESMLKLDTANLLLALKITHSVVSWPHQTLQLHHLSLDFWGLWLYDFFNKINHLFDSKFINNTMPNTFELTKPKPCSSWTCWLSISNDKPLRPSENLKTESG